MSTTRRPPRHETEPSDWALSAIAFGGIAMLLIGFFQGLAGIAAIVDGSFYTDPRHYALDLSVTAWGWIHLLLGAAILAVGAGLLLRRPWAGIPALALLALSSIANFLFIPHYPIWSLLMIGLDVWVIWALTRPGAVFGR